VISSLEYDTRLCAVVPATVGLVGSLGLAPPYFNGVWGDTDAVLPKDFSGSHRRTSMSVLTLYPGRPWPTDHARRSAQTERASCR
jgi:hypothetical protein